MVIVYISNLFHISLFMYLIKEECVTTKLQVDFNSLATITCVSFNDFQINGSIIQDVLFTNLI